MSFIAKNNTVLFEAFGDNLTMICERKKRQTVLLYITYFMEDVKPHSAQWSRLVICKSKFLLGMEFNLTNASVIYLWNLVLQIAFTSGIVSKIPYKQTRCNR